MKPYRLLVSLIGSRLARPLDGLLQPLVEKRLHSHARGRDILALLDLHSQLGFELFRFPLCSNDPVYELALGTVDSDPVFTVLGPRHGHSPPPLNYLPFYTSGVDTSFKLSIKLLPIIMPINPPELCGPHRFRSRLLLAEQEPGDPLPQARAPGARVTHEQVYKRARSCNPLKNVVRLHCQPSL